MNIHAPSSTIIPQYEDIVERNAITLLAESGDLTTRDGDIAFTRRGDLMINDDVYSALSNLVMFWQYNFSTLQSLFLSTFDTTKEEEQNSKLNRLGSLSLALSKGYTADSYCAMEGTLYAMTEARKIYAGSIILVIGQALNTFRVDIRANTEDWNSSGLLTKGGGIEEPLIDTLSW